MVTAGYLQAYGVMGLFSLNREYIVAKSVYQHIELFSGFTYIYIQIGKNFMDLFTNVTTGLIICILIG